MVKSGAVTWDEINVNYRTFSLNFGVRAGTQEDYDWIEEQMWNGDDFRTFATALSWMTDTEASIPVIERVRENAPDQFAFTMKEFGRQYLQRDVMLNWMIANSDVVYNEHDDSIPTIMTTMCAYIQTNADKSLIDAFEASLETQVEDGEELARPIRKAFEDCQTRFEYNQQWQDTTGAQIVLWLRYNN